MFNNAYGITWNNVYGVTSSEMEVCSKLTYQDIYFRLIVIDK